MSKKVSKGLPVGSYVFHNIYGPCRINAQLDGMYVVSPKTILGLSILAAIYGLDVRQAKTDTVKPESLTIMHGQALYKEQKQSELKWNGVSVFSCTPVVVRLLSHDPEKNCNVRGTHWQFAFAGSTRQALLVESWQGNQGSMTPVSFLIDNENGFGYRKLMLGGTFDIPHKHLIAGFCEMVEIPTYDEVIKERNVEAFNAEHDFYFDWLKTRDPELLARLLKLKQTLLQQ